MFDLENLPDLHEDIRTHNTLRLSEILNTWQPQEIAELMSNLHESEERALIFSVLTPDLSVRTFEFLPIDIQKEFLNILPSERSAQILNALSPDDRTAFLEELSSPVVNELIKLLSSSERATTLKLLGYPEDSVGRIMTPDYIAVRLNWTVQQVLNYIRVNGHDSETIDVIYIVDDNGDLVDDVRIKEFLFASPEALVSQLSDGKFIALEVTDTQEDAINIFRKNNRVALPVVDKKGILLGIVTIDDILNLAKQEDTRDIQLYGGVEALDLPYMKTPFFELMRKRVGWLVILFIGEMLTATAMGYYQDEISRAVILTMFLPLIISSGGNSGSQASTLIIRALALGEVSFRDWWRVMRREILSGLFLGSVLGAVGFLRVVTWAQFSTLYGPHWFLIALTVFFSLIGIVLWGTLTGSMLPLILRRVGLDPATCSAPFVATLVDVTGIIIYFSIALIVLQGTLL